MNPAARAGAIAAFWVLACTSAEPRPEEAAGAEDSASAAVVVVTDSFPPVPRSGFLAARTVDPSQIIGEWPAAAGSCPDQRNLQILVDTDSMGVLIVLAFPDSGALKASYRVSLPDGDAMKAGTARLSVQRMLYTGLAYAAASGRVDVSRWDRRAAGGFDVLLVDAITGRESRYLGAFADVRVATWPADLCVAPAGPDSVAADSIK